MTRLSASRAKLIPFTLLCGCALTQTISLDRGNDLPAAPEFVYFDATGAAASAPIVQKFEEKKITSPNPAGVQVAPQLARAATIAEERANAHSKALCWRYVKDALLAAGAVTTRPQTALAKEAGDELVRDYGFRKLPITDPFAAPVGAVLVYNATDAPGHVEIRTKEGFVSDFRTKTPSHRPLIGVYAKA